MTTPIDDFLALNELTHQQIERYFSKLPKYRGRYYVQMRAIICRELRNKGLTLTRISELVFGTPERHDQVIYYIKRYQDIPEVGFIFMNHKIWIREGLYPMTSYTDTSRKAEADEYTKTGYVKVYFTDLKLEKL